MTQYCAIISKKKVQEFVEKSIKENVETAFQLYFGKNREKTTKSYLKKHNAFENGFIKEPKCTWGVAIGLPTKLIDEMIKFGNGYYAWQDDTKIKYFLMSKRIDTVFPIPCLVDHRKEASTLTPCVDFDKTSDYFIDNLPSDIPKIIHQIWIGDKTKMPTKYMDTWKMDGWEHYRAMTGQENLNKHTVTTNFVEIDDWTEDFDFPKDLEEWLKNRKIWLRKN